MNGNWGAIRQDRERGSCAITYYAPRDASGQSVRVGRHYVLALRLVHVFDSGGLISKFVSLYGGMDGANALLQDELGSIVLRKELPMPAHVPVQLAIPIAKSRETWPFNLAAA